MRNAILFVLLLASFAGSAQFRLASDGFASLQSTVNDSTYVVDVTLFSDLTGSGYSPTNIQVGFYLFSQREQVYRISAVSNLTFGGGTLTIIEQDINGINTEGAPIGQVMVYDPPASGKTPQVPFGSTGATSALQAAVVSYNSRVNGGTSSGLTEPAVRVITSDSVSVERSQRISADQAEATARTQAIIDTSTANRLYTDQEVLAVYPLLRSDIADTSNIIRQEIRDVRVFQSVGDILSAQAKDGDVFLIKSVDDQYIYEVFPTLSSFDPTGTIVLDSIVAIPVSDGVAILQPGPLGYNVRAFGAVGDGVTNDQPSMQYAARVCLATGQDFYVPKGNYLLNSRVEFDLLDAPQSGYTQVIHGIEATVTRADSILLEGGNGTSRLFQIFGAFGGNQKDSMSVKISGFHFDGNSYNQELSVSADITSNESSHSISIISRGVNSIHRAEVMNCSFSNSVGDGVLFGASNAGYRITEIRANNVTAFERRRWTRADITMTCAWDHVQVSDCNVGYLEIETNRITDGARANTVFSNVVVSQELDVNFKNSQGPLAFFAVSSSQITGRINLAGAMQARYSNTLFSIGVGGMSMFGDAGLVSNHNFNDCEIIVNEDCGVPNAIDFSFTNLIDHLRFVNCRFENQSPATQRLFNNNNSTKENSRTEFINCDIYGSWVQFAVMRTYNLYCENVKNYGAVTGDGVFDQRLSVSSSKFRFVNCGNVSDTKPFFAPTTGGTSGDTVFVDIINPFHPNGPSGFLRDPGINQRINRAGNGTEIYIDELSPWLLRDFSELKGGTVFSGQVALIGDDQVAYVATNTANYATVNWTKADVRDWAEIAATQDVDMGINEVTNASDATAPTSLTTLQQVQGVTSASTIYVTQASDLSGALVSDKVYSVQGVIDMGSQTIEVPPGGLSIRGLGLGVSKLISSNSDYTMFTSPVGGSGNLNLTEIEIEVTGTTGKVFELTDATGFHAVEMNMVNFNDCTSLGFLNSYRQGLELNTGKFGGNPSLTLAGNWVGGYRASTCIVRNVGATTILYEAGAGLLLNSRFKTDLNVVLPDGAKVSNIAPSEINSDGDFQIIGGDFAGLSDRTQYFPNMPVASTKANYRNNSGIQNTNVAAVAETTTEAATTFAAAGDTVLIAGTLSYTDTVHFTDVAGGFEYLSSVPIDAKLLSSLSIEGTSGDNIRAMVGVFDASAGEVAYYRSVLKPIQNLVSFDDRSEFFLQAYFPLDQGDRVQLYLSNETADRDVTVGSGSIINVEKR